MAARPLPTSDARVLAALGADGSVSFQGLRRLLGLHPQVLSRILRRLREAGLVAEAEGGYRLATPPALPAPHGAAPGEPGLAPVPDVPALPTLPIPKAHVLLHMALASPEAATLLASALTGRWFRSLRWIGKARMGQTVVLAWIAEPEGHVVRMVLEAGELRVEVAAEAQQEEAVHEGVRVLLPAIASALAPLRVGPAGPQARLAAPLLLAA